MINELCKRAHDNAVAKGFYETERGLPELLMLTVSELAEALEADRKDENKLTTSELNEIAFDCVESGHVTADYVSLVRGTVPEELADACIRIFDICGYYGIDLESHIIAKMRHNETRPPKHGKRY